MSRSLNKMILIGNLGQDPEVRSTSGGGRVANFSLATSRQWSGQGGDKQEKTEWHRIVAWNNSKGSGTGLADVTALWRDVYDALGATPPDHSGLGVIWFFSFEAGRGFLAMLLYVLLRPRLGPGARTAAWAGIVTWFAFSLAGPAQLIPIGFSSAALWLSIAAWQLVSTVVAAIAGAAIARSSPR